MADTMCEDEKVKKKKERKPGKRRRKLPLNKIKLSSTIRKMIMIVRV